LKCSHIGAILPYFYIADFCTPAKNPQQQRVLGFNLWVGDGGAFLVDPRHNKHLPTAPERTMRRSWQWLVPLAPVVEVLGELGGDGR